MSEGCPKFAAVPGVIIAGGGEPSKAFLDVCASVASECELKYMAPCKCTSRLPEVSLTRAGQGPFALAGARCQQAGKAEVPDTQVATPIQLLEALKRRGLAYQREGYVGRLRRNICPSRSWGNSVAQVIEADRLVHVRVLEMGIQSKRNAFLHGRALLSSAHRFRWSVS